MTLMNFEKFFKFYTIYYRNIGFFDIKFFKLILQTIILNINDSDQILKILKKAVLYFSNLHFGEVHLVSTFMSSFLCLKQYLRFKFS